jgi:Ca-activated chloride channel family protein
MFVGDQNDRGIALLILALARPQGRVILRRVYHRGNRVLCLVLDISTSMRAVDFRPNRLEAAKSVARKFIEGRQNDRIGLVVFAAESFLQCPLTIDYGVLKDILGKVDFIEEKYDGTAIGMAIANATNRCATVMAKSLVMILLSDGRNNARAKFDPRTPASLAAALRRQIYHRGAR